MDALLAAIVLWLSANFNLPASFDHPRIEFAPSNKIVALRYKGLANEQWKYIHRGARIEAALDCFCGEP
jgi:hypothetical protein